MEEHHNDSAPAAAAENEAGEQTGNAQPSQVSDEEVKSKLLVLLGKSDLTQTTEKMLRKQLEKELGVELSTKKALIRQEVLAYLEQHQPDEEDGDEEDGEQEKEEEEEEEEPKETGKKRGGGGGGSALSPEMQEFLGVESMSRPQVVKAIWAYIKENNLQDPSNKRNIIVDDKLATLFKPPINMFNMNKQLGKHVFSSASVAGDDAPAKPRPAKRAKKASDDGDGSPKRGTGFNKPIPLSDELAAACGRAEMSRGEFSKWLYSYCDEHDLKDAGDKRYANCDETLQKLTGEKRIMLFGGQKYFKNHFQK